MTFNRHHELHFDVNGVMSTVYVYHWFIYDKIFFTDNIQ